MNRRQRLLGLPLLLFTQSIIGFATFAQDGLSGSAQKVKVETYVSHDRIRAGSTFDVLIVLAIEPGWHLNAHIPSFDYLIGTAVEFQPSEGIIVSDTRYPQGHKEQLFTDEPLLVYQDTVGIVVTMKVSEKAATGERVLHGSLTVQACDSKVCLVQSTIPLRIPVHIVPSGETVADINSAMFTRFAPGDEKSALFDNEIARQFEENALTAFAAIFLVGLALNLTPCVYPMLSVTVSIFGAQSDTHTVRIFSKALVYVLGIATMYSVLGVTAALGGGLFGSWLQSSWVLAGIAALLFALALSMFGLYEIRAPYWLTEKLGGTTGTGIVSLYISGLVVGVFAAPCVGPPIIALLALVAAKGDPMFGFWTFFVLSLGLGLPYLILGTFSGLLKKIPRSGPWLVWVERIFGVVLTAAALFYLALAFAPSYSAWVVPLALFAGGVYLGFLEPSGRERISIRRIKWVFGITAVAFGLVSFDALRQPGVVWEPYSPEKLTAARASGQPVMLDFYADWCIPCVELDRKTFTDAQVIDATKNFVRLKVDLTSFDSPESEELRKQFNIAGVPTIVFLNGDGEEVQSARVIGYLPPAQFLERVKEVSPAL
ncbi:MAG TPA: cytochrome c biogenesis protein CcdA [Bacteroidota bacterium]|nr:cytochrome c biogenesis protein CcdA [Bacteroidota bacterium]